MSHQRHFVTVGGRQVHYRRAGSGPPVVLLHACPKSSVEQAPLVERLARRFTAIALDMPGYGESEPLAPEQPEIADFADALAATLDALGIARCAAYGRHTGGLIALEMGRRHPGRLSRAIFDGFPVFSEAERRRFLAGYLQPLMPLWDGLHLPGLWARMRENYLFFPWNDGPVPENRNDLSMPPARQLHGTAMDLLKVMDRWRVGYASAFRYRPEAALGAVAWPALIMARRDDLLYPHLERLPPLGPSIRVEPHDYDVETWAARIEAYLGEAADLEDAPPAVPPAPRAGLPWSRMAACGVGDMRLRRTGDGPARVLLLHDVPGSSVIEAPLGRALAGHGEVAMPDLPGIGPSAPLPAGATADDLVAALAAGLDGALAPDATLVARGLAAGLALRLSARLGHRGRVVLVRPAFPLHGRSGFAEAYAPPLLPDDEGTHLTRAWYRARDGELYWPWFERSRAAIRWGERRLDPAVLTHKVVAMAEDPQAYRTLALAAAEAALEPPTVPVAGLVVADGDAIGRALAARAEAALGGGARVVTAEPSVEAEAEAIGAWLAG